jgi:hypothetical protein
MTSGGTNASLLGERETQALSRGARMLSGVDRNWLGTLTTSTLQAFSVREPSRPRRR